MYAYFYTDLSSLLREIEYNLLIHRRLLWRQYPVQSMQNKISSRLDQSKIRKFQQGYAEFYEKSKSHKKLKLSIIEAEDKLRENGQNTAVFQSLKLEISKRKSKKSQESKEMLQDAINGIFQKQLSSNIRDKISPQKDNKISSIQASKQLDQPNLQKAIKETELKDQKIEIKQSEYFQLIPELIMREVKSSFLNEIKQQPQLKKSRSCKNSFSAKNQEIRKNNQKRKFQKISQSNLEEIPKTQERTKIDRKSPLKNQSASLDAKHEFFRENRRQNLLKRIQYCCLNNRTELIKILQVCQINSSNIKQILDLGVVNVLKDGSPSTQIQQILQLLKIILLFKYFPEDQKIKKKHHRLMRKRVQLKQNQQKQQEQCSDQNSKLQLRKKTLIKLENILRGNFSNHSKDYAIQIQAGIQSRDKAIGSEYKFIAYSVLRKLKDSPQNIREIMKSLEIDLQ